MERLARDQHVDVPLLLDDAIDHRLHRVGIGDIERRDPNMTAIVFNLSGDPL